ILGRYIITPEIFKILKGTRKGFGGEVQLTDALNTLSKSQKIMAYDFEGRRYDVGSKKGLFEANVEYALREEKYAEELKEFLKELHDKNYNI
ncbi:MAG: UTP--glucose-1-phosphate uridylyltransferase, partial [Gallicola sp.]|nr:UTP--glucose-1-phosphate uridylyltransferase [Gallicola sp.]